MKALIYDRRENVIDWLRGVLVGPDFHITATATDPVILYNLLRGRQFDIAISGALEACEFLEVYGSIYWKKPPSLKRVCLAAFTSEATLDWALQLGFDDLVDGAQAHEDTRQQLIDLVRGERIPQTSHCVVEPPKDDSAHTITINLHDQIDREIVRLIARGHSDREIAQCVFLSPQTIRNRVSRLLDRSGARNRTHLAVLYVRGRVTDLSAHLDESA
jgi:DNA-binding NarL/FixJ family response regulator